MKKLITFLLSFFIFLTSCNRQEYKESSYVEETIKVNQIDELQIKKEADNYKITYLEDNVYVEANKNYSISLLSNYIEELSSINDNEINITYKVNYDVDDYRIYLENIYSDKNGNVYYQDSIEGQPFYYEDGRNDVVFFDNDKTIYLSNVINEEESCFLFAFLFTPLAYTIIKAVLAYCIIVVASVIIANCVYQIVKATVETLAKAKEKVEENRNNNKKYFLAQRYGKGLAIAENPIDINQAVYRMRNYKNDFWTAFDFDAYQLAFEASYEKGTIKSEIDSYSENNPVPGRYYHYHPYNRSPNVHCWFGTPYLGVYY